MMREFFDKHLFWVTLKVSCITYEYLSLLKEKKGSGHFLRCKIIHNYFISQFYSIQGFFSFLRFYLFIFRDGGEKEGEKHQCVVASLAPSTGDPTWPTTQARALTGSQIDAQSTEPHQPGPLYGGLKTSNLQTPWSFLPFYQVQTWTTSMID